MDVMDLRQATGRISTAMTANRERLIELDQRNGDGDLGITMDSGWKAVVRWLEASTETDLGKLFMGCSSAFNESAPSTLGTITAFFLVGMAKSLRGKTTATLAEIAAAMQAGVAKVMEKAGSKPGEKTILDAVCPAVEALASQVGAGPLNAFRRAAEAAEKGSQATAGMRSVHGRAAYYGDRSIGIVDGGSVVGAIAFQCLADWISER